SSRLNIRISRIGDSINRLSTALPNDPVPPVIINVLPSNILAACTKPSLDLTGATYITLERERHGFRALQRRMTASVGAASTGLGRDQALDFGDDAVDDAVDPVDGEIGVARNDAVTQNLVQGEGFLAEFLASERRFLRTLQGIVEFAQDLPEQQIARRVVDCTMKFCVRAVPVPPGIDHLQQPAAQPGDVELLLGAGMGGSFSHHRLLQRAPDLEQAEQRLALEPDHGGHEAAGRGHRGREKGARAALAPDQAKPLPAVEGLA